MACRRHRKVRCHALQSRLRTHREHCELGGARLKELGLLGGLFRGADSPSGDLLIRVTLNTPYTNQTNKYPWRSRPRMARRDGSWTRAIQDF
jgi:hypothetical protein